MRLSHVHVEFWELSQRRPKWIKGATPMRCQKMPGDLVHQCINEHANLPTFDNRQEGAQLCEKNKGDRARCGWVAERLLRILDIEVIPTDPKKNG